MGIVTQALQWWQTIEQRYKTQIDSLNSNIKESTGVSLLVFSSISINVYLQVIAFHSPQNNVKLFHTLLNLMHADTSLNITMRVLVIFTPSTVWVKLGTIDWQSAHLTDQYFPPCILISFTYHLVPHSDTNCLQFYFFAGYQKIFLVGRKIAS